MTTTLQTYRRALSQELGRYAATTTTTLPTTFDADRQIISTYFRNDTGDEHAYDGGWIYIPSNAGTDNASRRVMTAGFSDDTGLLRMDRPLATPLNPGTVIEYHERFPAQTTEGVIGLRELVNLALQDTWSPGVLAINTTGAASYALPTWLDDDWFVEDVLDPPLVTGLSPESRRLSWNLRFDEGAAAVEVQPPIVAGSTLSVVVRRPNDTFINNAESTTGLVLDADFALPSVSTVTTVGAMHAYRWLVASGHATDADRGMLAAWEALAKTLPRYWPRQHFGLSPYPSTTPAVAEAAA